MDTTTLKEKYPVVKELTEQEQLMLFALMETFQQAVPQTIDGGEELYKMCDGCAFKKGTEANTQPHTVLSAIECIMKIEPFFCHKNFCSDGTQKICAGWVNTMNTK